MASKFKPHKNPDQIAKKHGVSTEAILKQLKIGVPIEHEHTNDKELATNIALQHLGEFPDYYTRIKKMESQAKKMSSKKLKEESSEKRYCALCNKKETRSECSYGGDMWDLVTKGRNIKEDHKEVASGKKKDEEGYMARIELDTIERSVGTLKKVIKKGDQQLPAWVQSKITRAADFIDTASEYLQSDEKVSEEKSLVDTIIDEIKEDCWKGYKQVGLKKKGKKTVPNCVPVSEELDEATRLQAETGNILAVVLSWKGRYYSIRMFFPQTKVPTRNDINFEINKIYPGAKVVSHAVSDLPSESPLIRVNGGNFAKPGPSKNYVKPMGEEVEISEVKKSQMKCNNPKAEAHGSGETGKSHVVKACEGGKEKLIRFGQKGVKGSPKKEGESKSYASRRHRFQTRHAKNIAKGKMSAAYWANKVKW